LVDDFPPIALCAAKSAAFLFTIKISNDTLGKIFMKRHLFALFMLVLVLGFMPVHAQETEPIPWPPDPAQIFAPGVEIINVEVITPEPHRTASAPQYPWDNELRTITTSALPEAIPYAYPDEVREISGGIDRVSLTQWLVNVLENVENSPDSFHWVWMFNPITGEFVRYEALCGQEEIYSNNILEDRWLFYIDPDTERLHLCEIATGLLSDPLPEGMYPINYLRNLEPILSPDSNWVVAIVGGEPGLRGETYAFSYEVATEELRLLGDFYSYDTINFGEWFDTQFTIHTSDMPEYSTRTIYIADVSQSNSLDFAVSRFRYWPEYFDDPPRYEFISGIEGAGSLPINCSWIIYDISTRTYIRRPLGMLCQPDLGRLQGTAYYREVLDINSATATLVRYNALTREREDLKEGEIELIVDISTNIQLATLVLDDSGRIDNRPFEPTYNWGAGTMSPTSLACVDLSTEEILFSVPTYIDEFGSPKSWLDCTRDETNLGAYIFGYNDAQLYREESYLVQFTRGIEGYTETQHINYLARSLDREKVLTWKNGEYEGGLQVVGIEDGRSTDFIVNYHLPGMTLEIGLYDPQEQTLVVTVWREEKRLEEGGIQYIVRVPVP